MSSYTITIVDSPNRLDAINMTANIAITASIEMDVGDPWGQASSRGQCSTSSCYYVTGNGAVLNMKYVNLFMALPALLIRLHVPVQ